MIETLLGQIKGVLGKSFLLAGLLPSSVLLLCWYWLRRGPAWLEVALHRVLDKPKEAASEAVLASLLLLALALVFYASRGWILNLLESLPGPLLKAFRERGSARQRRRLRTVKHEATSLLWQLTAFDWVKSDFAHFTVPPPAAVQTPRPDQLATDSALARQILSTRLGAAEDPDDLTGSEEKQIADALLQLFTLVTRANASPPQAAFSPPDRGDGEVAEWRALLRDFPAAVEVLRRVKVNVLARWEDALVRAQSQFPQQEQWVKPTVLGNRIAALDDYAEPRYWIATSHLWTRLWGVLPKEEKQSVTDARLGMEVLTNLCVGFFGLGLVALALTLIETTATLSRHCQLKLVSPLMPLPPYAACSGVVTIWRAVLLIPLAFLLSRVFYEGAVYAFGTLAEQMIRASDLYRLPLIKALGYKMPKTVDEELKMFGELNAFFAQAVQREKSREIQPPEKPKAKKGKGAGSSDSEESPPA